jgi:hypothetical protein
MTDYDGIAEARADEEWTSWYMKAFCGRDEIGAFVAHYRHGGKASATPNFYMGSFNFCVRVTFYDEGPDAIIRFPKPGYSAFREEKVMKEVGAIKLLQENTTIPLPRLIHWGLTAESPLQLGPFIITEFIVGTHLSVFLKDPTETDLKKHYLNPNINDELLDSIYDQLADFTIQIFQLNFNRIGGISEKPDLNITKRPLTYSMNDLATVTG